MIMSIVLRTVMPRARKALWVRAPEPLWFHPAWVGPDRGAEPARSAWYGPRHVRPAAPQARSGPRAGSDRRCPRRSLAVGASQDWLGGAGARSRPSYQRRSPMGVRLAPFPHCRQIAIPAETRQIGQRV